MEVITSLGQLIKNVMSEMTVTPEEEAKETISPEEKTIVEEPKEKTVGELLEDKKDVPLAIFLEKKKEAKALEKELSDLKQQIKDGATKSEAKAELKDIAEKYDVDPNFLSELSTIIYSKAKGDVEETLKSKLQPLEDKEREEKINKAFNEHYEKVIEELPEYADVINKDIIKSLSLLPQNANKTFQQIIEETYGKTVTGKKTLETATPRGGKETSLDMSRINDPEYFKRVMENPELKKKYNEGLTSRISL